MKRADFKFDPLREVKLVPDVLLNFQLTLDRLILFFMQICLHKVVTFIGLSAPCSQLRAWKFQRTEQNILGPDITETIVTAPLNKPTFGKNAKTKRRSYCLVSSLYTVVLHVNFTCFILLMFLQPFKSKMWNFHEFHIPTLQ